MLGGLTVEVCGCGCRAAPVVARRREGRSPQTRCLAASRRIGGRAGRPLLLLVMHISAGSRLVLSTTTKTGTTPRSPQWLEEAGIPYSAAWLPTKPTSVICCLGQANLDQSAPPGRVLAASIASIQRPSPGPVPWPRPLARLGCPLPAGARPPIGFLQERCSRPAAAASWPPRIALHSLPILSPSPSPSPLLPSLLQPPTLVSSRTRAQLSGLVPSAHPLFLPVTPLTNSSAPTTPVHPVSPPPSRLRLLVVSVSHRQNRPLFFAQINSFFSLHFGRHPPILVHNACKLLLSSHLPLGSCHAA